MSSLKLEFVWWQNSTRDWFLWFVNQETSTENSSPKGKKKGWPGMENLIWDESTLDKLNLRPIPIFPWIKIQYSHIISNDISKRSKVSKSSFEFELDVLEFWSLNRNQVLEVQSVTWQLVIKSTIEWHIAIPIKTFTSSTTFQFQSGEFWSIEK